MHTKNKLFWKRSGTEFPVLEQPLRWGPQSLGKFTLFTIFHQKLSLDERRSWVCLSWTYRENTCVWFKPDRGNEVGVCCVMKPSTAGRWWLLVCLYSICDQSFHICVNFDIFWPKIFSNKNPITFILFHVFSLCAHF